MRVTVALLACALAVVATAGATTGSRQADPGVTATTVLLGGTTPLTGEASAGANTARGAAAYFRWVNEHGGVKGRKINYRYVDDGYDPARTVQAFRQLVLQDRVFALFNTLGTAQNLAIRPLANQLKVPQLYVATGASTFGREYKRYPWTIGLIPTYTAEGIGYARYILKNRPKARIAILYQDDEYGRNMVAGLRKGLGRKAGRMIVARQSYDPTSTDIQSQMARLKSSGANTLMIFAFGKFAIQAFVYVKRLGWKPQIFVNAVAASTSVMTIASGSGRTEGAISFTFFKDPAAARWRNDRGVKLFKRILKRSIPSANAKDGYYMAGMAFAYVMTETLRKAGRNLTRRAVMRAATHLNIRNNPFVLPGIRVRTTPSDRFPMKQGRLERWRKGGWHLFGPIVKAPKG